MSSFAIRPVQRGGVYRASAASVLSGATPLKPSALLNASVGRIPALKPRERDMLMRGNATREANLRSWIAEHAARGANSGDGRAPAVALFDDTAASEMLANRARPRAVTPHLKKFALPAARRRAVGARGKTSRADALTEFDDGMRDDNLNPLEHTAATGEISPYQTTAVGAPTAEDRAAPALVAPPFAGQGKAWQRRLMADLSR